MRRVQTFVNCGVLPPPPRTEASFLQTSVGIGFSRAEKLGGDWRCLAWTGLEGTPPLAPPINY